MTETLLGLPLEEAVRRLRGEGVEPEVRYTSALQAREGGTLRVIRVRGEGKELTAAGYEQNAAAKAMQALYDSLVL